VNNSGSGALSPENPSQDVIGPRPTEPYKECGDTSSPRGNGNNKHLCLACHRAEARDAWEVTREAHRLAGTTKEEFGKLPAEQRAEWRSKAKQNVATSGIVSVIKPAPLFFIKSPVPVVTPELARIREEIKAERAKQAKKDKKVIVRHGHLYIVTSRIMDVGTRYILNLGEDHRLVKVGHALDPYQRIKSPQTFNAMADLTVVHTVYFKDRYAAESATHDLMEAWLFDREWFAMTVEEAKRIIEYVQRDYE
jgi:hypothetical protein